MPSPASSNTLAVILPSWVGDVVMATPSLRAVRAALPGAGIVALARPGLRELLEGTGLVDRFIDHAMRGVRGPFAAARALRALRVDTVLLLPNSLRSALAGRFTGAARRIGYGGEGRRWLLTDTVPRPRAEHPICTVDWYAQLVEAGLGVRVDDRRPRLAATPAQRDAAATLLDGVARPFVVLNPGANRSDKRWPAHRFAAVGAALRGRGMGVAVNGGPGERHLVAEVARACDGVDLAARGVTLGALVGVLADAALLVTNDTGPRHIAIGVATPVVALFGPTDHRFTAIPGARERRLLAEPFLPEEAVADRRPEACRIDRIEVGDVVHASHVLLDRGRSAAKGAP